MMTADTDHPTGTGKATSRPVRFRLLVCHAAGRPTLGDVPPAIDVRFVSADELTGGGQRDGSAWRKVACELAVEAHFDAVAIVGDPVADGVVAALVGPLWDGSAELVRWGPAALRWTDRAASALAGRPAGPVVACACAVGLLNRVPFELNGDGPTFDLYLLLQAIHVGATIKDVIDATAAHTIDDQPWSRLAAAARFRLHRVGILCALRYRNLTPVRYRDKTFLMYTSHAIALDLVRRHAPRTLLDIGCGPGFVASRCRSGGVHVTGIDAYEPLPDMMDAFHQLDLERDVLPVDPFAFDDVLMLDVIEHLADPESFLLGLRKRSESANGCRSRLVLSTPNVAFAGVRLNLLLGRFNYAERGILDVTHKRLFTRRSLATLLRDCGYTVERFVAVGPPFQTVLPGRLGTALGAMTSWMAKLWPSMFAFQIIVVARPRPGVRQLLREHPGLLPVAASDAG
jgi:SAM-dependent methyltransferase